MLFFYRTKHLHLNTHLYLNTAKILELILNQYKLNVLTAGIYFIFIAKTVFSFL